LVIDLASDDFDRLRQSIAKQWGPTRLGNEVQRVRSVFKFGYDSGLIDRPVRFGPSFRKPARKVMRQHRAKDGDVVAAKIIFERSAGPPQALDFDLQLVELKNRVLASEQK
jgi:hypothetical protein